MPNNYTLGAEISGVTNETNLEDNVKNVTIKIVGPVLGDINSNGMVEISDIILCALSFGSQLGDPKWNPDADLDGNGIIDIVDLVIIGVNFGKTL